MKVNRKKHLLSLLVVLSLALLIVVGSTVAYFSSKDESTNRFTSNSFDLILTETKWDPKAAKNVVPGDELDKNPQITNNDRTAGYVFLRVTVPCDVTMVENATGQQLGETANLPMYKFVVKGDPDDRVDTSFSPAQAVHDNWHLVPTAEDNPFYDETAKQLVYVYAYSTADALIPLQEGQTTEPLFDKLLLWNFTEAFDSTKSHSVRVEAMGIQSDLPGYEDSMIAQVWALLKGGSGG